MITKSLLMSYLPMHNGDKSMVAPALRNSQAK